MSNIDTTPAYDDEKGTEKAFSPTHDAHVNPVNLDEAVEILGREGEVVREVSPQEGRSVLWKIDMHLMPIMLAIYFLQQLDKSALSYSSVFGIQANAHLVGQQYAWLGSIVYFAQLIFQPLSSLALVKLPPGRWLASNVLAWGIVLSCMTAATDFKGLITARFFLGACEATVAPTFVTITQMWWRRREQPLRTALWYSMNGWVNVLGSLLTFGLGHISSAHLHSYQIIFLFCGLVTVAVSIPVFFILPDSPTRARFFSHEEKVIALERLRDNNQGTENKIWKWKQCVEAFVDPKTWLWFILAFCISVVSGGITTFGPLILQGFGYSPFQTVLHNMPPGAIQIVSSLGAAYIIQKSKYKSPVLFVLLLFPLAGGGALYALPRGAQYRHSLLAAYYILSVYVAITPVIYVWMASNTAGHTKKTTTTGILFVGQSVGNIVGPQLYLTSQKPYYHTGLLANLILLCVMAGMTLIGAAYLGFMNKRHEKRRVELGKAGKVIDYSLVSDSKVGAARDADGLGVQRNAKAFLDLTDYENEDFIFSL